MNSNLREDIRNAAPFNRPHGNFVIKSLRADQFCFFRDFLKTIIDGESAPLRHGAKKQLTVTAKGIFKREPNHDPSLPLKTPQYTPEQKQGYSKAQAASLGTPEHFPIVFGLTSSRQDTLTGVLIEVDPNVLFTDRNYIYDGGTVSRPYDFDDLTSAQQYYQRARDNKILFAKDEINDFICAIKCSNNYNEVLARLRWGNNQTSKIFIASDTLVCRLQAVEYARLLKQRLVALDPANINITIPIIYYMPSNPSLHFKSYTQEELELDQKDALECYQTKDAQHIINTKEYQLLLALSPEQLLEALQNQNIFRVIFQEGYVHLIESFIDKLGPQLFTLLYERSCVEDNFQFDIICHLFKYNRTPELIHIIQSGSLDDQYSIVDVAVRLKRIDILDALYAKYSSNLFNLVYTADDPKKRGVTLVLLAALNGDIALIKWLKTHGANMNDENDNYQNALFLAIYKGHLPMVIYLLKHERQLNKVANIGGTPLECAINCNQIDIAEYLIKHHYANINERGVLSISPLTHAAREGNLGMVEFLVKEGAKINPTKDILSSPLAKAAIQGNIKVVEYLVKHGAILPLPEDLPLKANEEINLYIGSLIKNQITLKTLQSSQYIFLPSQIKESMAQLIQHTKYYDFDRVDFVEKLFYRVHSEQLIKALNDRIETINLLNAEIAETINHAITEASHKLNQGDVDTKLIFNELEQAVLALNVTLQEHLKPGYLARITLWLKQDELSSVLNKIDQFSALQHRSNSGPKNLN